MINVRPEQIPESEMNVMTRSLLSILTDYYEDPENKKEFEEWQKRQEKEKAG